ncbi:hypothetical protein HWB90_gp051 [Mycobacterium phage Fowlmouth]|uniref:Uncharacterized protein n=2 Tax=Fowlmouthvirus fowlmouth TaxID=2845652 RepID=A0A7G8LPU2_9CAUD|nr:hypothetical protein HWB90_gp051 [Mycobacterium phage Fowlmouth]AYN58001.1 hypothetical protein SEA_FOWLMOUTH_51 [Mycobacterium phage Fowlmouth]QNJ59264.1 hypothetical protein SEA_MRMIYAGI_50 [Mycobacterium phage MrMiyagi]
MTAPIVLNVLGYFSPSPKYANSVAMVLDLTDSWDDDFGDVDTYGTQVMVFYRFTIQEAYAAVNAYIQNTTTGFNSFVPWRDASQLIDIITEGQNWIVTTDSDGFVNAECFPNLEEAERIYLDRRTDFQVWAKERP